MAANKLYSFAFDYRAVKTLVACQYNGVEIEVPEFKFPGDAKRPEFKAKNPNQKVPVLETPFGTLWESNAILRYVARLNPTADLLGKSFYEQGLVDQWLDFCQNELEPSRDIIVFPLLGYMNFNKDANKQAKADLRKALAVVDQHLLLSQFLVGNSVTIADIAMASALVELYQLVFTPAWQKDFVNITRWFNMLTHQPEFEAVLGTVKFAEKEAQPPKQEGGKKKGKKEKAAAAKPAKKKEAAPALPAAKPKKEKNPLDLLPPSPMIIDNIKRLFSNEPANVALETFWKEFDAEGWSLWTAKYNYDDENKVDYMTSNLITGWIGRLESLRKYGFGSVCILGEEEGSKFPIRSAWIIRSKNMIPELAECPDSEYHTFTHVDPNNAEDKARWENYFTGETVEGQPVYHRMHLK
jgi:elongation factor 1-gamma